MATGITSLIVQLFLIARASRLCVVPPKDARSRPKPHHGFCCRIKSARIRMVITTFLLGTTLLSVRLLSSWGASGWVLLLMRFLPDCGRVLDWDLSAPVSNPGSTSSRIPSRNVSQLLTSCQNFGPLTPPQCAASGSRRLPPPMSSSLSLSFGRSQ